MIKVSTQWISRVLKATMVGGSINIDKVSTDTRTITPGALFIALKGPNFDGHEFAAEAVEKGAGALVVDHRLELETAQIIVTDTTAALGTLAAAVKAQAQPKTIAVTGSVGKTTVKEMAAAILSPLGKVLATAGNFNNEIGVPLTLLQLEQDHDFAVIELGANHAGEIAYTTGLTKPDVCMVNNVAAAHLEGFGSLEGVARAKGEIYRFSEPECVAVINLDSEFSRRWLAELQDRPVRCFSTSGVAGADVWVEQVDFDQQSCAGFDLCSDLQDQAERVRVQLNVPGKHNISNALAAATMCLSLGASLNDVAQGLANMQPVAGRVNLIKVNPQLTVIDDSYNANVESAKAAVDLLNHQPGLKILVLGDMAELGTHARAYHELVGQYANRQGIDHVLSLGELSRHASAVLNDRGRHFTDRMALLEYLYPLLEQLGQPKQQQCTVLVKGSRSAKMEWLVKTLVEQPEQREVG